MIKLVINWLYNQCTIYTCFFHTLPQKSKFTGTYQKQKRILINSPSKIQKNPIKGIKIKQKRILIKSSTPSTPALCRIEYHLKFNFKGLIRRAIHINITKKCHALCNYSVFVKLISFIS